MTICSCTYIIQGSMFESHKKNTKMILITLGLGSSSKIFRSTKFHSENTNCDPTEILLNIIQEIGINGRIKKTVYSYFM